MRGNGENRPSLAGREIDSWATARGGAVAARRAHNPKVVGSNPTPATKIEHEEDPLEKSRGFLFAKC